MREHEELPTLPRRSVFGKDVDERSRVFKALQVLISPTEALFSRKLSCPTRLPLRIGESFGARLYLIYRESLASPIKNRGINENASKCFYRCRNVGERLSSCHLNKQRLINPLEAEVNESVWLIESMGVTPPYKISRFHRASHPTRRRPGKSCASVLRPVVSNARTVGASAAIQPPISQSLRQTCFS
jgi:hypothetical protein